MKKKRKDDFLFEDDNFVIYQVYRANEHLSEKNKFRRSDAASSIFGTNVPDTFYVNDNKGSIDVDEHYDYTRVDSEKHLTEEDIIERHGSKYYEFDILDNKKIDNILGGKANEDVIKKEKEEKKTKKKTLDSFVSSIDDLDDVENEAKEDAQEEVKEVVEKGMEEFEIEFEDDYVEPKKNSNPMPENEPTSIPSFLIDEKKNDQFENPVKDDDFSFNNIPSMEAPEIKFDNNNSNNKSNYYNPAVDRNLTVEEAMKLSQNGTRIPAKEEDLAAAGIPTGNINNSDVSVFSQASEGRPAARPHYEAKPQEVKPQPTSEPQAFTPKPEVKPQVKEAPREKAKSVDYSKYSIPYKKLFPKSTSERDMHPQWLEDKKEIINQTLKAFGIDGEVIDYTKGPAFTLYEIMLAPGVNVKKVGQIHDNLQMNLQVPSIRILLPIPGKNTIGVEAPNDKADVVKFGDILSDEFVYDNKGLNVALGEKIDGSPLYENIPDMPHALIAGATQSGKSVSINTILVSLLIKNSPENLRLILVDPKKVELSFYNDIPHLATPVINDPEEATASLKWACYEMDRRYEVLARNRVRKISDYLNKRKEFPELEPMPFIVIVVDEFNDLVMQCGDEVNDCIVRLAQKARACGIHIILATQRPTVDVVNGTIKANVPCRIAFRVSSQIDSQTILDEIGAEDLLGRGDMLIKNNGNPIRAQGAYISDDEIEGICSYLTNTYEPTYLFTHEELQNSIKQAQAKSSSGFGGAKDASEESDELIYEIAKFCIEKQSCSINSIQQNFKLGFNRASRIVELLEERQIVSRKSGTSAREILVDTYQLRDMFGVTEDENY